MPCPGLWMAWGEKYKKGTQGTLLCLAGGVLWPSTCIGSEQVLPAPVTQADRTLIGTDLSETKGPLCLTYI